MLVLMKELAIIASMLKETIEKEIRYCSDVPDFYASSFILCFKLQVISDWTTLSHFGFVFDLVLHVASDIPLA